MIIVSLFVVRQTPINKHDDDDDAISRKAQ